MIGLRVGRVALRKSLLLLTRQLQPQLFCYFAHQRLLHGKHVREFALVFLAPELGARRGINQIHLNVESVTHLTNDSH